MRHANVQGSDVALAAESGIGTVTLQPASDPVHASSPTVPKKRISAKKLAANRANARKSTGPRTSVGKARASGNALTHGLSASREDLAVLPCEDLDAFEELSAEMIADLRPRGAMERELVGRIVSLTWRLRRIARLEQYLWQEQDEQSVRGFFAVRDGYREFGLPDPNADDEPPGELPAMEFLAKQFSGDGGLSQLERIGVYEQRLDRALHAALRQLRQVREMREMREERDEHELPKIREEVNTGDAIRPAKAPSVSTRTNAPRDAATTRRQNEPTAVPGHTSTRRSHRRIETNTHVPRVEKEISQNEPTAPREPARAMTFAGAAVESAASS